MELLGPIVFSGMAETLDIHLNQFSLMDGMAGAATAELYWGIKNYCPCRPT